MEAKPIMIFFREEERAIVDKAAQEDRRSVSNFCVKASLELAKKILDNPEEEKNVNSAAEQ